MTDASKRCSRCDAPLGDTLPGEVCSGCRLEDFLGADGERDARGEDPAMAGGRVSVWFGSYELLEEVGRGGMGVIYKARQTGLDRLVALKMLLAGEFADAKSKERLLREAKIAARLTHPGIVTIHEVGQHDGRPFFAMEYVPGRNLSQACREGLLPVATAARYVEQIARAVHYAHQHGVIHRDLKPANVLIGPDDEPKLTDFGLTKSLVDPTQSLESAGSPNFMAPEQVDSSLGVTGTPTDVFGLGAILYYLLTGRPPALGETLTETLHAVVQDDPLPPNALRPGLPADLATIALRCLEKSPERRYASAVEVAEELTRWRRHEPILARPPSLPERLGKWVRRRPVVAGLSVVCVGLALFAIGGITWQWRRAAEAALSSRKNAYRAEIMLAGEAVRNRDWSQVRQILERTRPGPGESDLRAWEWRYLWQVSRPEQEALFGTRSNRIISLAVLPDGTSVAAGESEGGFSLWDVGSRTLIYELPEAINRVQDPVEPSGNRVGTCLVAIPGTSLLAFTDSRSTNLSRIRLWDTRTRTDVRSLPLPWIPRNLAVSVDGRFLAASTLSPDGRVLVFETDTGELRETLSGRYPTWSSGHSLTFAPDGKSLTIEEVGGQVRWVEWESGRELGRFSVNEDFVLAAAFSPDGQYLVATGGFKTARVRVWKLATQELVAELEGGGTTVLFDRSGRRLISGQRVWSVPEFKSLRSILDGGWSASVLLADEKTYLSSAGDGERSLGQWNLEAPERHRGATVFPMPLRSIDFHPQGQELMLVDMAGQLYRATPPEFVPVPQPQFGTNISYPIYLPELNLLGMGRVSGGITLYDAGTLAPVGELKTGEASPVWLQWMAREGLLIARCGDRRLQVWDMATRTRLWDVELRNLRSALCRATGKMYEIQTDGKLLVLDVVRRRLEGPFPTPGRFTDVSVSADGQLLLLTSSDGPKAVMDTRTFQVVESLPHLGFMTAHSSAFWPREGRIVLPGAYILEQDSGQELLRLKQELPGFPAVVDVSPDGSILLMGDAPHNSACVWWAPPWEKLEDHP